MKEFVIEKEILNNMIGKTVTVYHADDMTEDGPYTEFTAEMQGYRIDEQFGVADIHFQAHKDIEINLLDDVDVSDDEIVGGDVCGLFFTIKPD